MDFKSQLSNLPLKIGATLNVASNTFLWLKLFLIYPILLWQLEDKTHPHPAVVGFLLLMAMLFDYFRKVRYFYLIKENEASIKQINQKYFAHLDRLGDLPLNLWLLYSLYSEQILSPVLLIGKLLIDVFTLGLVFMDRGPKRLKLFNYIHLMSLWTMLLFNQKWLKGIFNHEVLMVILLIHISLFSLVFLFQIRLLQKRFIADTLSAINLLCGVASMHASAQGKFGSALLYLLLGAAFDGFDGAAARKFGGTKFGVYSDDIADGVNYGIAPGVALSYLYQGYEGIVLGTIYSSFVLSRLVFFTLNKKSSDPNFFAGIPSPVGGMIVMSSIVLFMNMSTWVGFMVGVACALMVSFSTHYRHMGRALSKDKRALIGAPLYFLVFLIGGLIWGVKGSAATILFGAVLYGFMPSALHFISVFRSFFWGDPVEGGEGTQLEGAREELAILSTQVAQVEDELGHDGNHGGDDDVIDGV